MQNLFIYLYLYYREAVPILVLCTGFMHQVKERDTDTCNLVLIDGIESM